MAEASRKSVGTFDYIIVGAGSAGCVLANRLSADPDVSVLLLEAGGRDNYIWIHIPAGFLYTRDNPRTDWCYVTEAEAGLNGRAIGYPRGRTLGGCSSINGMIYIRGQARDYDQWRQLGNAGWGWSDVLPYFVKSEDHHAGGDDLHGAGGEWRVEEQRSTFEIMDAFRDAAAQCGIPATADFNRGDNTGCAYYEVNQRRGRRVSTATAFLNPVKTRRNLTILTHAQAERLRLEGKRVTGLDFRLGGRPVSAEASGEVLLAAGAIGSPQILELSGIGRGDVLSRQGIAPAHELTGVGENLQDHLQLRFIYKVAGDVSLNRRVNSPLGRLAMGLRYLLFRRGPVAMPAAPLGLFAKSDPDRETPNLQFHMQPLSIRHFGEPLHGFPGFTATVCNLRPESRGSVHVKSAAFDEAPAIRPNYLSAPADRKVALDSMALTRRIMASDAMAKYRPEEHQPGAEVRTEEDMLRAAGDIGITIYHPVGTCKMGADPMAVVDDRLHVHGIGGLRVVDASVMPTITSGNTNAPTIMIAEKASDMIREDRLGRD